MKIIMERKVTSEFELLREPTPEEIGMIENDEIFDIEDLVDWDKEEIIEEDFSYGLIEIISDKGNLIYKRGH